MFNWVGDLLRDIVQGDYLFVVALTLLVSCLTWRLYWRIWRTDQTPPFRRFFGLSAQIGLILMMERLYEFSRAHIAVDQLTALAYHNGYMVSNFEITHGLFIEQRLERLFLNDNLLMHAIFVFYGLAHLFVTLGFLIWLYVRRNWAFSFVRNLLYLTTGMALVSYMMFPTSPPRMFSNLGFIDPSYIMGLSRAGGEAVNTMTYNPYAAMPSLHLVYALIVGGTVFVVGKRLWLRALGAIYPVIMLAVILISANHWVLDAFGAVAVVAASVLILYVTRGATLGFKLLYTKRSSFSGV